MRRVLVPLDGSKRAEGILDDACRIAGADGELYLVRESEGIRYDPKTGLYCCDEPDFAAGAYLVDQAGALRRHGMTVVAELLDSRPIAMAIAEAAARSQADFIACATHGGGPLGRMVKGSVAWQALAHSPVPVLLRHVDDGAEPAPPPDRRHIMVPLDGSALAEHALPLAEMLAREWNAPLWLVRVVPLPPGIEVVPAGERARPYSKYPMVREAQIYLDRVKVRLSVEAHADVLLSAPIVDALIAAARTDAITDVVMVSHGYTGLSRLISGSVADAMLHALYCPMLVIPARTVAAGSSPSSVPTTRS